MTKIIFECSGGILDCEVDLTLNLNTLPSNEAQNLLQLIRDSNFFNLPANLIRQPEPENAQYAITVDVGIVNHTVRATENTAPPSLKPLLAELFTRMDPKPV
jgi:Emfourin